MLHLRRIGAVSAISTLIAIGGACGPSAPTVASPVPPAATADTAQLATTIGRLVGTFGGTTGIVIAFPGVPEPIYATGADTPVVAASLYKLAVLLRMESLVESGALSYDDKITIEAADVTVDGSNEPAGTVLRIDEALEQMIAYSDNGSALALLRLYGAPATNARLAAAGIKGFHVAENTDEDNIVTARAVGTFFDLLATRRLVSPAASDRMLARLTRQTINDRLPRDLPQDVTVAHKTGDLVGLVVHDAGVIQAPDGPRIAVVLTSGGTDAAARDLIAQVGAIVYSATLPKPPGARSDPLPSRATRSPGLVGAGTTLAVAAIGILLVVGLVVWRSGRRRDARPGTR